MTKKPKSHKAPARKTRAPKPSISMHYDQKVFVIQFPIVKLFTTT